MSVDILGTLKSTGTEAFVTFVEKILSLMKPNVATPAFIQVDFSFVKVVCEYRKNFI